MSENTRLMTCRYSERQTRHDAHFHNAYEILYIVGGRARITVNDHTYEVGPQHIVFISNFEEHHAEILEEPYCRYFATFETDHLDKLLAAPRLASILKNRPVGFDHCVDMSANGALIENLFRQLLLENDGDDCYTADMSATIVRQLLMLTDRAMGFNCQFAGQKFKAEIYEIQRYIEEHYTEDIQVGAIAEMFYINPYYLSHCFKELTGYSPKRFLLLTRLSKAKEMLLQTDWPVNEVSYKSGFSDTNNFIRYFKREVGITPHRFRYT